MPAAMTKEQYHAAGEAANRAGNLPAKLKPGTWQSKAYLLGYAGKPLDGLEPPKTRSHPWLPAGPAVPPPKVPAHVMHMSGRTLGKSRAAEILKSASTLAAALEARRAYAFQHWPSGASEHMRLLAHEIAKERNPHRVERLMRAVSRMTKKYGHARQPPHDFPMSTVPCPEGPVTVGDLLAGR